MASPPYERKCSNWLKSYLDWTVERSQVQEKLILWSGIFTLAASLRRKIAFTRTSAFLGSHDIYPYLYVMVVGPAGTGKTTTARYSFDLVDQIPVIAKPPTFTTVEGLVDDLGKAPDQAIPLIVEEWSDIMMKDPQGRMYAFLTSIYDGKANIRQKTMSRDLEFADKPCVNVFGGTTPEWIADNIPLNTLNGGFGSRFIWLYIPELRRRRMYYKKEMTEIDFLSIEKNLIADLKHIATELEGEYTISQDAMDYMEEWNANLPNTVKYKKLAGYITSRKSVFVHKVALILHVSYSDTKEVNLFDFLEAIKLVDAIEPGLPKIFDAAGKNDFKEEMRAIVEYVKDNPGIKEAVLKEEFQSSAAPAKLHELIEGLLMADLLKSDFDAQNKRVFFESK